MAIVRDRQFGAYADGNARWLAQSALERAQKYFGTDDDRLLALAMAEVLFGSGESKGVKVWTDRRLFHLGLTYYAIKDEHPRMSDAKIAELICKNPDFKGDAENVRQRLGAARHQFWRESRRALRAENANEGHAAAEAFLEDLEARLRDERAVEPRGPTRIQP